MNFLNLLPWWGWALSTLGIGGIIAVLFLAPVLAADLFRRLSDAIGAAIRTPLGAALIFGGLAFAAGWFISGIRAQNQCNAVVEKLVRDSKDRTVARDKEIREELRLKYEPAMQGLEEKAAEQDKKVTDYEDKIAGLKDRARCELGPDALDLLMRPD